MEQTFLISVEECCSHYDVAIEFIDALEAHGLLLPTVKEEHRYLEEGHLQKLEKFINMHYEMEINMEGIEVISRLLERIESLQTELRKLQELVKD